MVISNILRRLQNQMSAEAIARKRQKPAAPKSAPKPAQKPAARPTRPGNQLLPEGVKVDDAVPVSELNLPARAIAALEDNKLETKGDIRLYLKDHKTMEDVKGIGKTWAGLIEKQVG